MNKLFALYLLFVFGAPSAFSMLSQRAMSNHKTLADDEYLKMLGNYVLKRIGAYRLKTPNSVASIKQDADLIGILHDNIKLYSNVNGNRYSRINTIHNMAKTAIEYGVANCTQYTSIAYVMLLEIVARTRDFELHFASGKNFDHAFIVLRKADHYYVVDPWLRKVFPLDDLWLHLERAKVLMPSEGHAEFFSVVIVNDGYNPNKHNFDQVVPRSVRLPHSTENSWVNNGGFLVPYEDEDISYNPDTDYILVAWPYLRYSFPQIRD